MRTPILALLALPFVTAGARAALPAVPVEFAGIETARKALADDSASPYFQKLSAEEIALKTGETPPADPAKLADFARERHAAAALEFLPDEKAAITALAAAVDKATEGYPGFRAVPWKFIKVDDKIEGRRPHTRGGHIILPKSDVDKMTFAEGLSAYAYRQILVAEKVRVHQRMHPGFYDSLYTGVWKWRKMPALVLPESLEKKLVHDPDGDDASWALVVMKERFVDKSKVEKGADGIFQKTPTDIQKVMMETPLYPLVIINDTATQKTLRGGTSEIVITLEEREGKQRPVTSILRGEDDGVREDFISTPLVVAPEFKKNFPTVMSPLSPKAVAADIFSTLVLWENIIPDEHKIASAALAKTAGLKAEREWFQNHFAK